MEIEFLFEMCRVETPSRGLVLSSDEKQKARDVRGIESCVRCSILRVSCDVDPSCYQCCIARRLFVPCMRKEILFCTIEGCTFGYTPQEGVEIPNKVTVLQHLELLVTAQVPAQSNSIGKYFINLYSFHGWAENALKFMVAAHQYVKGSMEYREICGELQNKLLLKVLELGHLRTQTLEDWWRLYNLIVVLVAAWQDIFLSDDARTCMRQSFDNAVTLLAGIFQYHTLRMKKTTSKRLQNANSETQKWNLPECLLEMGNYRKEAGLTPTEIFELTGLLVRANASDPFLPRLVKECSAFLQLLACPMSFRVAVIGQHGVGKTTLISQYLQAALPHKGCASNDTEPRKVVEVDSHWIDLRLSDNPVQYLEYDALAVLFDASREGTFTHLKVFQSTFAAFPGPILLVGTHTDIDPEAVSYDEGHDFAKTIDAEYVRLTLPNLRKAETTMDQLFRQLIRRTTSSETGPSEGNLDQTIPAWAQ